MSKVASITGITGQDNGSFLAIISFRKRVSDSLDYSQGICF